MAQASGKETRERAEAKKDPDYHPEFGNVDKTTGFFNLPGANWLLDFLYEREQARIARKAEKAQERAARRNTGHTGLGA